MPKGRTRIDTLMDAKQQLERRLLREQQKVRIVERKHENKRAGDIGRAILCGIRNGRGPLTWGQVLHLMDGYLVRDYERKNFNLPIKRGDK